MPWKSLKLSLRPKLVATMAGVIMQIILLDIVFSLDSVITAIGMAQKVEVMIAAIVIAIFVMLLGSGAISGFIHQHPSVKILALSFLLLIGVTLIAEGFTLHIPKGYIYFAMGFSGAVETINLMAGHRRALQRQKIQPEKCSAQENIWKYPLILIAWRTMIHLIPGRRYYGNPQELLDILACPQCKGEIKLNEPGNGLICEPCQLMYEIKDDIPIMLIEKAKKLPNTLCPVFL